MGHAFNLHHTNGSSSCFWFNEETAANNYFQSNPGIGKEELQQKALAEFDNMVQTLRSHAIDVVVIEDTKEPAKPDAIFPNNWLSTSPNGTVGIFPMYATQQTNRKKRRDTTATCKGVYSKRCAGLE